MIFGKFKNRNKNKNKNTNDDKKEENFDEFLRRGDVSNISKEDIDIMDHDIDDLNKKLKKYLINIEDFSEDNIIYNYENYIKEIYSTNKDHYDHLKEIKNTIKNLDDKLEETKTNLLDKKHEKARYESEQALSNTVEDNVSEFDSYLDKEIEELDSKKTMFDDKIKFLNKFIEDSPYEIYEISKKYYNKILGGNRRTKNRRNVNKRRTKNRRNVNKRRTKNRRNVNKRRTKTRRNVNKRRTKTRRNVNKRRTKVRRNVNKTKKN